MSNSLISLGLGFGGGKASTSNGRISGGGATPFTNTYSVNLDGTNDYVDISGAASSLNGLSAFSVSLWYNTSVFNGGLIAGGTNANNAFWISRYTSSRLYFNVRNGGATFLTVNVANADNTWHHVVGICDGSSSKVYVNGSVAASGTLPSLSSTGANNLVIGYIPPLSGNYCSGLIDEVAIFNSALSASDITAIYNSGVPDDLTSYSPVGWWRMGDNNSGTGTTITDQGSGGNDGTLTNGPTFSTDRPYALPSITNTYSVDFDGTDDYMDLPDSTDLEVSEFTWSAWFYCTAIDRYNIIVDTATNSSLFLGYEIFVVNTTNKIRFSSYHASDSIDSTTTVTANTWFHVAATHASGSDKLYVNGSLEASGSASSFAVSDVANLRIGSSSLFNLYHQGLIDEVSFFNSALSASDITAIYNSGVPADISSLNPVGWWRMGDDDGGTGTIITDQGSGGNNGTLTNGPTFSTTVPS